MSYPVERYGFTSKRNDRPFYIQVRDCSPVLTSAHIHDALEFGAAAKGKGFFFLNGKVFPIKTGDFYLTYGGHPHTHYGAELKLIVAHLSIESVYSLRVEGAEAVLGPFFSATHATDPLLHRCKNPIRKLLKACDLYAADNPLSRMAGCVLTLDALIEAIKSRKSRPLSTARAGTNELTEAIRFIESSYTQPVTVREIARHVHLSESRFSHLFSEFMNTSPLQFRNRLRVQEAVELLQTGTDKISSIALQCGFNDLSQFNRFFRKTTGRSPGGFRN